MHVLSNGLTGCAQYCLVLPAIGSGLAVNHTTWAVVGNDVIHLSFVSLLAWLIISTLGRMSKFQIERLTCNVSIQPADGSAEEKKKGKQEKVKKCIRTAAGSCWEDQSLLEWDTGTTHQYKFCLKLADFNPAAQYRYFVLVYVLSRFLQRKYCTSNFTVSSFVF